VSADTNNAPIWRSGIGVAVEAIDAFRRDHRMAVRQTPSVKAYDALLDRVLQDISEESRVPWNVPDYHNATDCAKCLLRSVKEKREARGGDA
jgi:hypothetical protein